jgi:hypothetical protein
MDKVFSANERRGYVRAYQIGAMLRSLNPELVVDPEELKSQIANNDPDGTYYTILFFRTSQLKCIYFQVLETLTLKISTEWPFISW